MTDLETRVNNVEELKIAIGQHTTVTGDIKGNTQRIVKDLKRMITDNVDLGVFAELGITGYMLGDLPEEQMFLKAQRQALDHIAQQTKGTDTAAYVGFIDFDETKRGKDGRWLKYNAAAVIQDGKIVDIVRKSLLPNYRYFQEARHFNSLERPQKDSMAFDSPRPVELTLRGEKYKLGFLICEDMWDDDYDIKVVDQLVEQGAQMIINASHSPFGYMKNDKRHRIIKNHIAQHALPWVYVNGLGIGDCTKNMVMFDGRSTVYDETGKIVHELKSFAEDYSVFTLAQLKKQNKQYNQIPDAQYNLDELQDSLVFAIREFVKQSPLQKVVIGLSGGIDSAVDAALCVEALGAENVICINMPTRYNSDRTKTGARDEAEALGLIEHGNYIIHPIEDQFMQLVNEYQEINGEELSDYHQQNIQARARGAGVLAMYSAAKKALIINNGNKSELFTGYCTMYGDMVGAIGPILDVWKHQVYQLARNINKRAGREIIPKDVIELPPSAELSSDHDVDAGKGDPFFYEAVLDPMMRDVVEGRQNFSQLMMRYDQKDLTPEKGWPVDEHGKTVYDYYDSREKFGTECKRIFGLYKFSRVKGPHTPNIPIVSRRARGWDLREPIFDKFDDPLLDWYIENGNAQMWEAKDYKEVEKTLHEQFAQEYF